MITPATSTWTGRETDAQRLAILAAADRLLTRRPTRSSGNLSVVQLAVEAGLKYWVVAQKRPDLREHFQTLASQAKKTRHVQRPEPTPAERLQQERDDLARHCAGLEELLRQYATVINELALENKALREQLTEPDGSVIPIRRTKDRYSCS